VEQVECHQPGVSVEFCQYLIAVLNSEVPAQQAERLLLGCVQGLEGHGEEVVQRSKWWPPARNTTEVCQGVFNSYLSVRPHCHSAFRSVSALAKCSNS